ncbi:hypothetical protein BGP78_06450 [Pseudoalteromonas sp. MSK9-3]|uniref:phage tail-collar fiber domain-containing protein n=1 Tax=Pseudoalteromonas sp. MSK9-3 TaxID=1897633 RepID=UPI000E6B967B|nr:phage tail protein [Pseudoalteromonas sp. MSK9-3]RJE78146.1 hypothetical protein BGP78_06450 [Pseudoalteromonas sp. MSK9-3]
MSNSQYWTILTRAGREKVLAAIANKHTVKISEFAVGDGQITHTSDDLSNLKYRSHTSSLKQLTNNNALIEVVGVVPATEGGFYVREAAFYTDDGQAFAIINYPETYKPAAADNAAAELGIKAVIDVVNAQVISEKIDPSVIYATKEWVSDQVDHSELSVLTQVGKNWTFDNGTSTTVNIVADNAGLATLNVCSLDGVGNDQTTGRVYVGQSLHHGGGIEYNGDNNPVTTGAGADYISLFRSDGSGLNWTAKNHVHNNDWEFRGAVKSPNFIEAGTSLKDKYLGKTAKAVDTAKLEGKTKAEVISEARAGLTHIDYQSSNFYDRSFRLTIPANSTVPFPDLPATACDILVFGSTDMTGTSTNFVGRFTKYGSTWSANKIYGTTDVSNHPSIAIVNNQPVFENHHGSSRYPFEYKCWIACQSHANAKPFEFFANTYSTQNKPTPADISVKLNDFETSKITTHGHDFKIRSKRALVGFDDRLVINYNSDWSHVDAGGTWRFRGNIERNSHNSGYLVGSYNNIGPNERKTNPIYTIGSNYQPNETELNNMYGIGYAHGNASFVPDGAGWGMYVAADGDARIFLDASHGRIHTTGDVYEAGTKLSDKYLGKAAKAVDSSKLNGAIDATEPTANTIVKRNAAGDLQARLLRATYPNQTTMNGAIAFRVNNHADNYTRYCSNPTAIADWLKSPLDSRYLGKAAKAVDAAKLEGKTKAQVISEARNGLAQVNTSPSFKNATFDNGTSTIVNINADDAGLAALNVCSGTDNAQTTGRVYVGQSFRHGGGIEYNGDNTPATTGAGADYVTLFRKSEGHFHWTAKNLHSNNDWEFRGAVASPNFIEAGKSLKDKYLGKTAKAVDAAKLEGKTKAQVISEARAGLMASDVGAVPANYLKTESTINANEVDSQGVTFKYLYGGAENKPAGVDHALQTLSYSADWSTQMASDWRTNRWYVRTQNSGNWESWAEIYTSKHKPTPADISDKLARFESSLIDVNGQDFKIRSKRALVGHETELAINHAADWPVVRGYGTWSIEGDLKVKGDLKMTGSDSYIWTPNTANGATGIWDTVNGLVAFKYTNGQGFDYGADINIIKNNPWLTLDSASSGSATNEQAAGISLGESGRHDNASLHLSYTGDGRSYIGMGNLGPDNVADNWAMKMHHQNTWVQFRSALLLGDGNTNLSKGGGNSLRIKTNHGYVDIGPKNSGHCHYATDRSSHWFDKNVNVNGEIYAGSGYSKRVYHEGYKPSAADVGAFQRHYGITPVVNKDGFTTIAKIEGYGLSSSINLQLKGTSNGTVVNVNAAILVNHHQDIVIDSLCGGYTTIQLKIISNNNEQYLIQAKLLSGNPLSLRCDVLSYTNDNVSIGSYDTAGFTYEHAHTVKLFGRQLSSSGATGMQINGHEVAHAGNISSYAEKRTVKASGTLTANSKNHLTATATFTLPDVTNLSEGTTVVASKAMAVTPTIKTHGSQNGRSEHIAMMRGTTMLTDTSVLFDRHCTLTFILNSAKNWEMQ